VKSAERTSESGYMKPSKHFYEFGPFRIDSEKRRLVRNGEVVPVTPKAFDTLLALVESRGRVVEKDDLMEKVWPGVAVEENNLTQNISALRKALGEKRDQPEYILTVSGQGYRFVASVSESSDDVDSSGASEISKPDESSFDVQTISRDGVAAESIDRVAPDFPTGEHLKPTWKANPRAWAACLLVVGLTIAGFGYWRSRSPGEGIAEKEIKSIAVLPFKPLAAEGADEYLLLGMADALITRLSNVKPIIVRPTSSVVKYANSGQDLVAIGRELEVDSLLEGRVQKSNDRIRVTVTLVRVKDGASLWASKFDEKYTDVFTLEDRISEQVARSLLPTLTGTQKEQLSKHYTEDTEAYQSYIEGRYYWNKRTSEGVKKAIGYFEDAIIKDSNYALAYAGLADSYATLRLFQEAAPQDTKAKARSAALKALELDDELAEAHAALGYVKHRYEWDWSGAEREFKRAIELKPEYGTAHQYYGWYLITRGQFDAALEEFKRAQQLDPLSLYVNLTMGAPFYYSRQFDKAVREYKKVIEMDPKFPLAHRWLGKAYLQEGTYEEATTEFQKVIALLGGGDDKAPSLGYIYAVTGRSAAARSVLSGLKKTSEKRYVSPFYTSIIYVGLGEKDHALEWLERAYEVRDPEMVFLNVEPQLDVLRSDARFKGLLAHVGLAE
jgi:DNA-binding winged helix-turn-helix (wHTH) protein/TolB-like protein/TolA-binding protein